MQLRAVRVLRSNMESSKSSFDCECRPGTEPLLDAIASSNLIPRLSELFLKGDGEVRELWMKNLQLLEIVAWILANLDSPPAKQTDSVSRGVVKTLVRVLT